jgi:hypothetical protein
MVEAGTAHRAEHLHKSMASIAEQAADLPELSERVKVCEFMT